jgi:amidohydrolase family protein
MCAKRLVLNGAQLIDGTGQKPIANATIVIDDDRVTYAGARTDHFDKPGAQHLDLAGKTVVPGLLEAHTHAAFDADMRCYLKNGITTIRFAGLNEDRVSRLRGRIERGEIAGPRILSCGPMIDEPSPAYPEWSVAVTSPDEGAAVAERLIREYDLHSLIVTQRVTALVMKAVIDVAHRHGRRVVGQIWAIDGEEAAKLGIDELHTSSRVYRSRDYSVERLLNYASIPDRLALTSRAWASFDWDMTQPIIDAMISYGVIYCGMQVITQFQTGDGVDFLENDADFLGLFGEEERQSFQDFTKRLQGSWTAEDLDYARRANARRMEWMRKYLEMGGKLVAGTDMQFGGIMLHRELRNLEELGLSKLEVVTAATGGCARALHIDNEIGIIREGLCADLIILNRDPLSDLGALRDIDCVVKSGAAVWSKEAGWH